MGPLAVDEVLKIKLKKIKNIYKFITLNKKWGVKKMKICGKKLIAGAAALAMAMACSPIGGFATENSVSITKVEILNDGTEATVAKTVENPTAATTGITLTTAQLMRVTAELKDSTPANIAGEISFLSNFGGENITLDNSTIQYVDQQTYDGTTAVTITFRPRTTINNGGIGTFVAKAGGTDVATAATFNYTVEAPKSNMTFTATTSTSIKPNESVSFSLKDGETNVTDATIQAKNGDTVYNATYDGNTGLYTITFAAAGTYTVTATKEGYNTPTTITVTVVENTTVPDDKKEEVTNGLKDGLNNVTQGAPESTLPSKAGDYDVEYTITVPGNKITQDGNKISLKEGVFAAKVTVTAKVGEDIEEQKVIYLVSDPNADIAFGNLGLVSTDSGSDAFADDTAFENVRGTTDVTLTQVEALNYALGRKDITESPIKTAIDYDKDGYVVLAEYRMFKLMLEGNEIYKPSELLKVRAEWVNKAKN